MVLMTDLIQPVVSWATVFLLMDISLNFPRRGLKEGNKTSHNEAFADPALADLAVTSLARCARTERPQQGHSLGSLFQVMQCIPFPRVGIGGSHALFCRHDRNKLDLRLKWKSYPHCSVQISSIPRFVRMSSTFLQVRNSHCEYFSNWF